MAKRKISARLRAWQQRYANAFFGIDPTMREQELLEGKCTVREYQDANMNWIEDYFNEIVAAFE